MTHSPSNAGASSGEPESGSLGPEGRKARRRQWALIAVAIVAIAAVVGFFVVDGRSGEPSGSPTAGPEKSESASPTGPPKHCNEVKEDTGVTEPEAAPEDAELEVVESGSSVTDPGNLNYGTWTYGVILENSSGLVAKDVTLTFTAVRPDGERANDFGEQKPWEHTESISFLYPGQEFGTGHGTTIVTEDLSNELEVKVDIDVKEWWKADNDVNEFAKLTAVVADADDQPIPDEFVEFSIDSDFCKHVDAEARVILRDSDGNIIGGKAEPVYKADEDDHYNEIIEYAPGHTDALWFENYWGKIDLNGQEFDVEPDLSQTSVYPIVASDDKG